MVLPVSRTFDIKVQTLRLETGSRPVVGSSSRRICGSPIIATAVLSFLLVPPLKNRRDTVYGYAILDTYYEVNLF